MSDGRQFDEQQRTHAIPSYQPQPKGLVSRPAVETKLCGCKVRASIRFQISRGTRFGWAVMLNAATLRRRGHRSRIHERQCRKSVETNRVRFCIDVPSPSLAQCRISDQNVGTPVHPPIIFIYSLITRKSSTACRQIVYKTIYFKYTRENIFSNRVLNV